MDGGGKSPGIDDMYSRTEGKRFFHGHKQLFSTDSYRRLELVGKMVGNEQWEDWSVSFGSWFSKD